MLANFEVSPTSVLCQVNGMTPGQWRNNFQLVFYRGLDGGLILNHPTEGNFTAHPMYRSVYGWTDGSKSQLPSFIYHKIKDAITTSLMEILEVSGTNKHDIGFYSEQVCETCDKQSFFTVKKGDIVDPQNGYPAKVSFFLVTVSVLIIAFLPAKLSFLTLTSSIVGLATMVFSISIMYALFQPWKIAHILLILLGCLCLTSYVIRFVALIATSTSSRTNTSLVASLLLVIYQTVGGYYCIAASIMLTLRVYLACSRSTRRVSSHRHAAADASKPEAAAWIVSLTVAVMHLIFDPPVLIALDAFKFDWGYHASYRSKLVVLRCLMMFVLPWMSYCASVILMRMRAKYMPADQYQQAYRHPAN